MEKRYFTKNGDTIWVRLSVSIVRNDDGSTKFFISQIININEIKKVEEKLKKSNEIKDKFIKVVSHQIRTPLTALRWNLNSLMSGNMGELTSGQKEILKTINDVTEDTINIFKDLLTVIDIQEDYLHLEISEYSIESLWTSMVWDLKQQAERKKIKKLQFH